MPQSIQVLHVDDAPNFRDMTATFLERADDRFEVQTATSAAEGLEIIQDGPPDCIVSDYDMPRQDGIAFLERVRDEWPDLPFILFTGKGSEEVASEAISAGVTNYLQKESGTDQYTVLANRIQNAVERVRTKREQERQLEAIETAQEGISILDEDGHYLYVNEVFATLHGYDPDEMIDEHWSLAYPDGDVSRVTQEILPEVEQTGYWHGETTSLRADGTTVAVDHTLAMTDRGELVCTVRDISDRKEREQRIQQSAAKLEALFENSPDMINIHDTGGNIIDPNPRLCEKTGYDAETLTGINGGDSTDGTTLSRRSMLVASGVAALGGLSGCLNRVASATTNTTATPAGVFMRGLADGFSMGTPHVTRLTPTLAGEVGGMSGEVELEGWVTAVATSAANYNNTRSNKAGIRAPDTDGDGSGDDGSSDGTERANYNNTRSNRSGIRAPEIVEDEFDESDETFQVIVRLDEQLEAATVTAWAAISKRSARTGRNPELDEEVSSALDEMDAALTELRAVLERCSDEACVQALANVADRETDLQLAKEYADDGNWDAFGLRAGGDGQISGGDDNDIIVGDYLLPPPTFNVTGSYMPGEKAVLFRYLDGESIVAERCTVCLPNAEVPGGNGSIAEEVTPQRIIDYLTGHSSGAGRVYSWRDPDSDGDGLADCDDADDDLRPDAACGTTPHFVAEMSKASVTGSRLVTSRGSDGSVAVASSPASPDGPPTVWVPAKGDVVESPDLSGYGTLGGDVSRATTQQGRIQGLVISQVMVQPPGCPVACPALLYVGRGLSDDQLVYSGGWVIDDAALYENSQTVLSMVGATPIVGVDYGDMDGDGFGDVAQEAAAGGRPGQIADASVEQQVESGVLPSAAIQGNDRIVRKRPGRTRNSDESAGGDEYGFVTNVCVDASVLHLMNAGRASNEVKFKAGAELSGQIN